MLDERVVPRAAAGSRPAEQGVVLLSVLFIGLLMGIVVASFLQASSNAMLSARKWGDADQALTVAMSALEKAKWDIYERFVDHFHSEPMPQSVGKFDWFDTFSETSLGAEDPYSPPQNQAFDEGTVTVTIKDVSHLNPATVDVFLHAVADVEGVQRNVQEMVRYRLSSAGVFNYTYFINNYGWLWGSSIRTQGDVRANADFSCRYDPTINGDAYAATNSDFGASGNVEGGWDSWSLSDYYDHAPSMARPGDPPSSSYDDPWPMGYDADTEQYEHVPALPMPYLGNLSWYETLAQNHNGQLSQGGSTLVNQVYDGDGPDGADGTADDGMVVLHGTAANPIQINGPVVVQNDVAIRGYITGQGTIYSGRNIHIAGELKYANPPNWPKPDSNPEDTLAANTNADMVGLAAKGNIILGDYTSSTWYSNVSDYIRPSFTHSYQTDPSDYDLGYDSDWDPDNGHVFDGDYTAADGGQRIDRDGNTDTRRYYQSSNDQAFQTLNPTNDVQRVDAVCYTNHLFGGKTEAMNFNGSIVARDEAIIFSNYVNMTWDIRLGSPLYDAARINFALPQTLNVPITIYWREL